MSLLNTELPAKNRIYSLLETIKTKEIILILERSNRKNNTKETEEESPPRARYSSVIRNERKAIEFQTIAGGKNAFPP